MLIKRLSHLGIVSLLLLAPCCARRAAARSEGHSDVRFVLLDFGTSEQGAPDSVPRPNGMTVIVFQVLRPRSSEAAKEPPRPKGSSVAERAQRISPMAPPPSAAGDIEADNFVPSGYQGDARDNSNPPVLMVQNGFDERPHTPPSCTRITYRPRRPGWAALSYLPANADPSGVWGTAPGTDYSREGFRSLRVWVRGVEGEQGFPAIQIVSGGNTAPGAPHPASYQVTGPTRRLTGEWREVCMDIPGPWSNVFSPLTVVMTTANNPGGAVFDLDSMKFSAQPCR
jgi:hypothetical protein